MATRDMSRCAPGPASRRRIFWATQPDACGVVEECGPCGVPGLSLVAPDGCATMECNPAASSPCPGVPGPRSIDNTNYVRGLALNILLTDQRREDTECGHRPGERGGHWSDAYRRDGQLSGSRLRNEVPCKGSVNEAVNLIRGYAQADLEKLVRAGVAVRVEVEARYAGNNVIDLDAKIFGMAGDLVTVGISGTRLANGWAWTS